ncbi:aminopeptidase N-like [Scaptodrosophila lebanonensis]|uniref:Aminopeptidase n=1 Tax=Drosophila lebanonensis TaxID=7225 RepID=A0A6J2U1P5_DROLE|nr:aminopeptidase N-like [Scaptodrosophila lebanonensis]
MHKKYPNSPVDAKLVWTAFQESVAMPTYQIAFSLNKFESRISSDTNNSTTFRTWARKYALNQTEYAAEIAPQLLEFLEVFLETPYDLPKVDNLALPDFAYASSSNWGLNIFTEDAILFDEKRCTLLDKQSVAMNIAKELAHQWFGNLVSIEWWHDVWLKDAFAEYIAGFGLHMIEPSWYYMDRRTLENEFKVLELDAHVHTDPVATPVANDTEVWAAYDKNSVRKAIALLGMLHRLVGDEIIINTYRQYLQQFSHKTATQKDFWTVSQREADNAGRLPKGMAIAQLMESWTLQMGYPILNVTRDYKKRTARITQQRFFITPLQATDEGEVNATKTRFYCWWVPLSYTNASSKNFDYTLPRSWLTCKNKNFAMPVTITDAGAPQDWLVLNLKLSALYRVNYDSRNWELIKATLDGDNYQAIHKINRAQLVDDALNLAWSGTLTYHFSLGLIGFLKREEAYMVWAAAARSLDRVNNIVKNSPAYPVFKSFMRDLLGPKFDEIFVKPSAGNSLDTLYRVIIFQQACHYELLACVNFARDEFAKLRRVPTLNAPDSVPADIQETLFCTAIRFGNEADWTWLKNNYMRSNVAAEQKLMLAALGCSRDTWSLEIMLKWTFAGKLVRKHAAQRTFRAVVKNPLGYHLAKKFLSENAFVIRNFCQNMTGRLVEVIKPLFEEVSTQEDLDYWTNFLRSHFKNMPGIERLKKLLLELGKDNMFWRRTKYNELLSAIRSLIKIEEIPEL